MREHLLGQDLIYVGGGSVVSMLGVWRAHGIDAILREAWEARRVLCGLSAGSLCWFSEARHELPRRGALGAAASALLPWSNCVHYGNEAGRREAYHEALRARDVSRATPSATARRCTSRARSCCRAVSSRADAAAYSVGWTAATVARASSRLPTSASAAARSRSSG